MGSEMCIRDRRVDALKRFSSTVNVKKVPQNTFLARPTFFSPAAKNVAGHKTRVEPIA